MARLAHYDVTQATFEMKVEQVFLLDEKLHSPVVSVRGLEWWGEVEPVFENGAKYLFATVNCRTHTGEKLLACFATFDVTVVNHIDRQRSVKRSFDGVFSDGETTPARGSGLLLEWDTLRDLSTGFVKADALTLEMSIRSPFVVTPTPRQHVRGAGRRKRKKRNKAAAAAAIASSTVCCHTAEKPTSRSSSSTDSEEDEVDSDGQRVMKREKLSPVGRRELSSVDIRPIGRELSSIDANHASSSGSAFTVASRTMRSSSDNNNNNDRANETTTTADDIAFETLFDDIFLSSDELGNRPIGSSRSSKPVDCYETDAVRNRHSFSGGGGGNKPFSANASMRSAFEDARRRLAMRTRSSRRRSPSPVAGCSYSFDRQPRNERPLQMVKHVKHQGVQTDNVCENIAEGDKVVEYLRCQVCLSLMEPPIRLCRTGHSVCSKCRPRLHECPSCKICFINTRNFGLEGVAQHVYYPCNSSGCEKSYLLSQKRSHIKECLHREVKCMFHDCSYRMAVSGYRDHLTKRHQDRIVHMQEDRFEKFSFPLDTVDTSDSHHVRYSYSYTMLLDTTDHIFQIVLTNSDGMFYACVQLVGTSSVAREYEFSVCLPRGSTPTATFPVHSYLEKRHCLCIELLSDWELRRSNLLEKEKLLTVSCKISRRDEQQPLQTTVANADARAIAERPY